MRAMMGRCASLACLAPRTLLVRERAEQRINAPKLGESRWPPRHRGQRHAALEAWDRFQEAYDLVSAQHDRQLARLTRIGDALRYRVLAERHAIEEPQRADDLVQRRP